MHVGHICAVVEVVPVTTPVPCLALITFRCNQSIYREDQYLGAAEQLANAGTKSLLVGLSLA